MEQIYYNIKHPAGYGGASSLYKEVKGRHSFKKVKNFLNKSKTYRKFKNTRGTKIKRAKLFTTSLGHIFQADLFDMQKLSQPNKGYKWILIVIDCFSRYMSTRPLKKKKGENVSEALDMIFSELRNTNRLAHKVLLGTDLGGEFYNPHAEKIYKKYEIGHYALRSPKKAWFAENAGKYLTEKLYKYMYHKGTKRWYDKLEDATRAKNLRKLKSLGNMSPDTVSYNNQSEIYDLMYSKAQSGVTKQKGLEIGQKVQITMEKLPFSKAIRGYFSEKIYVISNRQQYPPTNVFRYTLTDTEDNVPIAGSYYEEEIYPVE